MKIGDKVVCIDNSPCATCGVPSKLIRDTVYVIAGTRIGNSASNFRIQLMLVGIPNPNCHISDSEVWHSLRRFRLLDELKQQAAMKEAGIKFL